MNPNLMTAPFDAIHLDEMDQVKLMNRVDTKYWFHLSRLNELLSAIKDEYFILNIDGQCIQMYSSMYYDTDENTMFSQHHNGKLNRYKVRRRSYLSSGISFLEVKIKNNKGKTQKKRLQAVPGQLEFSEIEEDFLENLIPYESEILQPTLSNKFSRLTLVNKSFQERCTIDLNIQFEFGPRSIPIDDLVIVEIKSDGYSAPSPLKLALRDMRIKPAGFSKYCVGRTLTDTDLKRNNFKRKIRRIVKIIQTNTDLYNHN